MKKMQWKFRILASLALVSALLVVQSCDEDDPVPLELATITAGSIDLNGATSPSNVPVDATITVTFSTDVDASTANSTNIKLTRDYDDADIPLTINATGSTVTIDPTNLLNPGALFVLSISEGLKSTQGVTLAAMTRNFTTIGTFAPDGAIAYWTFEDNANDIIGAFDPAASGIVAITYGASHNASAGKAAVFNGTTSIIEVPNASTLMNNGPWSLSFWVKPVSEGKTSGHFVLGLGAYKGFQFEIDGAYASCKLAASYAHTKVTNGVTDEDLWFNGSGEDKDHGGWQGWDFVRDLKSSGGVAALLKDKWAHVVVTYNSSTKAGIMYINGQKMKSQDFDLWPDGDDLRFVTGLKYQGVAPEVVNELAFGFIQSRAGTMWDNEDWGGYDKPGANHFKGSLDDVLIYNKVISEAEVTLMYNSGK
jgi:hypothetical protein